MTKQLISLFLLLLSQLAMAQETFPKNDVNDTRADAQALVHATLHIDHETVLKDATLLISKGKIVAGAAGLEVPAGYVVVDLAGKHVYPSFIDPYTQYGLAKKEVKTGRSFRGAEVIEPETKGAYGANDAIKAHHRAAAIFTVDEKTAKSLREAGFGAVLTFQEDGLARGTGALVTLEEDSENNVMVAADATAHYSLNKGSSKQNYPSSTMGAIALLRQTDLDARWYASQKDQPFTDQTLNAWSGTASLPQIFEARGWKDIMRAAKLGKEIDKSFIVKGSGDEYQRAAEIKATGLSLIVPLNFPKPPAVKDPLDAYHAKLDEMKHWELAPSNAAILAGAGVPFAFTTAGLKKTSDLRKQVREAMERGLSEGDALKALTLTPATLLGAQETIGSLANGRLANLLITDGPVFAKESRILENWVRGKRYVFNNATESSLAGNYELAIGARFETISITGKPGKYSAKLTAKKGKKSSKKSSKKGDKAGEKLDFDVSGHLVTVLFKGNKSQTGFRLSGWRTADGFEGSATSADGKTTSFKAVRSGDAKESKDEDKKDKSKDTPVGAITYPFAPFGWSQRPSQELLLIKNATVWTNEAEGILTETDVLVKDGKIAEIGKNLSNPQARVIDGTGKHLTAGIVDEHSHIALDSVNDVATNSGMVRMSDVVDSEDVNIFRNLAGGVVAAQLLHGSANPIGGQSALIKMRWGATPEEMLIDGADGFIKFALGENVKRSSNNRSVRYPQTRMGVEQVYLDAFSAASDYRAAWQAYDALADKSGASAPRRDLALDTMVEIIESKRFITCHSYVQSEINMLMHVAERFDFRINTFTHILEGYKVADKMAAHGAGGSTFADWWAYKWEVRYAIPYNPSLMQEAGVTVAVNSDSEEMSRRLNQEAAKSVKYGGMSEEDALKMVTLNPAKLLHLDSHMGSVKAGKDADLVLWSDNPLSIYARAEKTLVDGIVYFDLDLHEQQLKQVEAERTRLIEKILKNGGNGPSAGHKGDKPAWHCDSLGDLELQGGAL